MMFVKVKDPNGTEALVTQAAFEQVWKAKGFTLAEEEPEPEPKPAKKTKAAKK